MTEFCNIYKGTALYLDNKKYLSSYLNGTGLISELLVQSVLCSKTDLSSFLLQLIS